MDEIFENWGEYKEALMQDLNSTQQKVIGPLLENEKSYLLAETAAGQPHGSTAAHDIAGFRKVLIPMIRRIIPGTIATELVGVQPMSGPVGLVYSLRYKYGEAANDNGRWPSTIAGNQDITAGDEAFGNPTSGIPGSPTRNSPYLRSFYSGGLTVGAGSPLAGGGAYLAQEPGASGLSHDGADGTSAPSDIEADYTTGEAWGSTLDALSGCTVGGSGSTIEGSGGRKMSLEVVSQAVEAGSRKLQAGWTIEAMQDLNAQHGLDLESEMTQGLSAEVVQEIDAEIIGDLIALAGTVATFDGSGAGTFGGGASGNYTPAYIGDRLANLGVIVNFVANEIARRTRRGQANFMVCSPMIVSVLQSAAKSVFAPAVSGDFKGPNNTMMVGTLNGVIKVYSYLWNSVTPLAGSPANFSSYPAGVGTNTGEDEILLGYKGGNGETDTGFFYAPYIPLMSSGVIVHPVTFQPVVSLMTRYGKTSFTDPTTSLGNSRDYYGKIAVNALDLQ
jgi:hypothetical protein